MRNSLHPVLLQGSSNLFSEEEASFLNANLSFDTLHPFILVLSLSISV